jgi:Cytochrome c oxidase subunit IV
VLDVTRLHIVRPRTTILELATDEHYWFVAWWIAFGPHGPRAEAPPGEWTKIMIYTGVGVAVSIVLFQIVHSFARPPPRTMTKEWQEATNEYLKVRPDTLQLASPMTGIIPDACFLHRPKNPTPSTVSAAKDTVERDMYRASRRRSIEHKQQQKREIHWFVASGG